MKTHAVKLLTLTLSVLLFLTACAPTDTDPLAYQEKAAVVSGVLSTDTGTFSVSVTLRDMPDGSPRRDADITLSSPETVSGITVCVRGQTVTMSSGGITYPVSAGAASRWLAVTSLFSLDGDVSSVTEDDGSVTVGVGSSPDRVFVSFVSGSDIPSSIRTEDGTLALSVQDYAFIEQITEGTDTIDS